jgi:hypothetical protein
MFKSVLILCLFCLSIVGCSQPTTTSVCEDRMSKCSRYDLDVSAKKISYEYIDVLVKAGSSFYGFNILVQIYDTENKTIVASETHFVASFL